jgi:hypothetical protein
MSVKGDFSTLNRLKRNLRAMPVSLAHDVAQRTAPAVTRHAAASFNSGRTVYDAPRPPSVNGGPLTLRETGDTEKAIRFVANGRIVRVVISHRDKYGRPYVKYLVGKYEVLPMGRIPAHWQKTIAELVSATKVDL